MKPFLAIAGVLAILFVAKKALKHIAKEKPYRPKPHNFKLNPQGFDDGEEYDNHIHV